MARRADYQSAILYQKSYASIENPEDLNDLCGKLAAAKLEDLSDAEVKESLNSCILNLIKTYSQSISGEVNDQSEETM